jgi:hypothetical protein
VTVTLWSQHWFKSETPQWSHGAVYDLARR